MESASSFSPSRSEVACEVQLKRGVADSASALNLVAVGRKLDRIHHCEANFLEEDNQAIAVAPIGGAVNVRFKLPLQRAR
jgi:hypothetical protein